jgi:hypothetical protein
LHEPDIVAELPEPTIAIEAEYPANPFRPVIVIHVLGVPRATQGADTALLEDHPGDLSGVDPIPPVEVERSRTSVMLQAIGADDLVVTRLAIVTASRQAGWLVDAVGVGSKDRTEHQRAEWRWLSTFSGATKAGPSLLDPQVSPHAPFKVREFDALSPRGRSDLFVAPGCRIAAASRVTKTRLSCGTPESGQRAVD